MTVSAVKDYCFKSIIWNVCNKDISVEESYVYDKEPQLR